MIRGIEVRSRAWGRCLRAPGTIALLAAGLSVGGSPAAAQTPPATAVDPSLAAPPSGCRMPAGTELTEPDVWFVEARACSRVAAFEAAAEWYERFARERAPLSGEDPRAGAAARSALEIRVGLGQAEHARALLELIDRKLANDAALARAAARADFSLGELLLDDGSTAAALDHFAGFLERRVDAGVRDLELRALVHVAAAHFTLGACPADAERRARRACDRHREQAWEYAGQALESAGLPAFTDAAATGGASLADPLAVLAERRDQTWKALLERLALQVDADNEDQRAALLFVRADKVANALGEALFLLGERDFEAYQATTLRPFVPSEWRPGGERCREFREQAELLDACLAMERYRLWTVEVFVPFARARDEAIDVARRFYDRLAYLQVPAWSVAAARRVGDMLLRFYRDLDNEEGRTELERALGPEVYHLYLRQIDSVLEPVRQQALEAYGFAVETARREQQWTEHAVAAAAALAALDPRRFPVPREIWAGPVAPPRQYAVPDLDPAVASDDATTRGLALPAPLPGVVSLDAHGRFHFWPAPQPPAPTP